MVRERLTGTKSLSHNFGGDTHSLLKDEEEFKSLPNPMEVNRFAEDDEMAVDMSEFDRMMRESVAEADRVAEDEQKKAREEQERLRVERLKLQEDALKREQEKKQRERDELMERLKK
jgi:hypothetical protein